LRKRKGRWACCIHNGTEHAGSARSSTQGNYVCQETKLVITGPLLAHGLQGQRLAPESIY
jgi:hypothetical protein